jgi:hypothetical protein
MIERIALHQTRLHAPGLGLDAKGVALGTKGLVLLPSIDRLVMLLAAYTREHSLQDFTPTLVMNVVRSKLGTREITFEFAAESSDRMDVIAETARLVGGLAFTGTARHFVQYRDSAAPFGYDAPDLISTDATYALYHQRFSQTYDVERPMDLRALLLRLMPRVDPSTKMGAGMRIVVVEQGLGPATAHYFVRSRVDGEMCIAEWPPENPLDDAPARRWVIRVPDLPGRMRELMHATPGITSFVPAAPGIAVEAGFRHPVDLRACPVFDARGLVLLRGGGRIPWVIDRLPAMAALSAFAPIEMRADETAAMVAARTPPAGAVRVPLRVVPSSGPGRDATATCIPPEHLPLLRRLAYALPPQVLAQACIAMTSRGATIRLRAGIEAIPLGAFFVEVHPNLYVPAGYKVTPAVAPDAIARAVGARPSHATFLGTDGRAWAIEEQAFVSLETALLEAAPWEAEASERIVRTLSEATIDLKVTSVGSVPALGPGERQERNGG